MIRALAIKSTALLCAFLFSSVNVSAESFEQADLLGFLSAQHEIKINPCVDESLLVNRYGQSVRQLLDNEIQSWPQNLCQDIQTARDLISWNYFSSALLASTDRVLVVAQEIAKRNQKLKQCKGVQCLKQHLIPYNEWARLNLNRTPVLNELNQRRYIKIKGDPVVMPKLALRNLKLPLTEQTKQCGNSQIDALSFEVSNIALGNEVTVVAKCINNDAPIWLLKQDKKTAQWAEVFYDSDVSSLYVLSLNRSLFPVLYSKTKKEGYELYQVYDYSKAQLNYNKKLEFSQTIDSTGRPHAFIEKINILE